MRARAFFFGLALMLMTFLVSCGTKYPISFHMEAEPGDPDKMIFKYPVRGKEMTFQKAGMIGSRDIDSFTFIREDPGTPPEGVVFHLTPGATNRYHALFVQNRGKIVLPVAGGEPRGVFRIGNGEPPAAIAIFSGLDMEDLKMIKKEYSPSKKEKEYEEARQQKAQQRIEKLQ